MKINALQDSMCRIQCQIHFQQIYSGLAQNTKLAAFCVFCQRFYQVHRIDISLWIHP